MIKQKLFIYTLLFILTLSLVSASNVFKYSMYDDCQLDLININFYNISEPYHFNNSYISYDSGMIDGTIYSMVRNLDIINYVIGVKADVNTQSGSDSANSNICIGDYTTTTNGLFSYFNNGFCIDLRYNNLPLYQYINGVETNLTDTGDFELDGNYTYQLYYLDNHIIVMRNNVVLHNITDFLFQTNDTTTYLFTTRYYSGGYWNYQHISYIYDILNEPCVEDWINSVEPCVNGVSIINYVDLHNCGSYVNLPLNNGTNDYCSTIIINKNEPQPYILPFLILFFVLILCTVLGFWKPLTFFVGALILGVLGSLSIYYKLDDIIIVLLYFMAIIYIGLALGLKKMKE